MTTIKTQNYGVEIELTGITRNAAADIIAAHFGTGASEYLGTCYQTYGAKDTKGRTWKCMRDSSIEPQTRDENGVAHYAYGDLRCEVVTPILQYEDLDDLQEIVRKLRAAGAFANKSCGIHVHVDGANHTPDSLMMLTNLFVNRQDMIYKALNIGERADTWCKKINSNLLKAMKANKVRTKASMEQIWYSPANDGYHGGINHEHYNTTRYHGINLHAFFTKGTVEFRLFNGTTHAGKIKAYIQFCLAMSAWAINAKTNFFFMPINGRDEGKMFEDLITRRFQMKGAEFKTARLHLLAAWKNNAEDNAA